MNERGFPENLQPQQFNNTNAVRHGAYSRRVMAPRAREIAEELLALPQTVPLDRIAAEEVGAIVAMIEAIDEELLSGGLTDRSGKARSLVDLRVRLSGRLERWLRQFGATPASRVEWVGQLAQGESLVDLVRKEVGEGNRLVEAARARGDVASPMKKARDD
jgi:hypothetical protein